jgi:hypothetical protein
MGFLIVSESIKEELFYGTKELHGRYCMAELGRDVVQTRRYV